MLHAGDPVLNGNVNGLLVGEEHKGGEGVSKSSTAWHNTRKLIYVKNRTGFWPIPESFWPDTHTVTLVCILHCDLSAANYAIQLDDCHL